MGKHNFSDEFKRDAAAQITELGYPVAEVSERLGVSQHSLYAWKLQLAKVVSGDASKDADIRLKCKRARVTKEREPGSSAAGVGGNSWRQEPQRCGACQRSNIANRARLGRAVQ